MPSAVRHPFDAGPCVSEACLLQTLIHLGLRRRCTDLVVDLTVNTVICYLVPWANAIGVVCERARGDTVSAPRAIAAEARDRIEDNGLRELASVELLLPVAGCGK